MSRIFLSCQHKTAIEWAQNQTPIFPCVANGKAPACPNGFKDATTDLDQIDKWWTENPNYNPAFSPGSVGWSVVDLDPGCTRPEMPDSYEVETPRGGRHVYFTGECPTTASKLGDHIDTRGTGGYVLLPSSIVDGKPYRIVHDRDLAPIPDWIVDTIKRHDEHRTAVVDELDTDAARHRARTLLLDCVGRGDVAISGRGGNNRTYQLACELHNLGLSTDTARELLVELWNPHCVPPWSEDELTIVFDNAARYAQNEPGAYAVPPAEVAFAGTTLDALLAESKTKPVAQSRFHMEDEDEQEQGADPSWLIQDLLPERSTCLMIGASGSFKSFLALDMALSIATSTATFGSSPLKCGLTFYGALEGRTNIKKARRRAWKIARDVGAVPDFFVGPAPIIAMPGEMQEFGDQIKLACAGRSPKLIVLDTLSKCMSGLNENDASDASKFIRFCDSLVEHFGCSVLVLHHTGKDEGRGARGSSAFHAGFDTVLDVKAHRASKAVAVRVLKHKDAEERETPWTFEGKPVAGSLVFFPTSAAEHHTLTDKEDAFATSKVGAALRELGAVSFEVGVTSTVLAGALTPLIENESAEARQARIERAARILGSLAREKLRAYCRKEGRDLRWFRPVEPAR